MRRTSETTYLAPMLLLLLLPLPLFLLLLMFLPLAVFSSSLLLPLLFMLLSLCRCSCCFFFSCLLPCLRRCYCCYFLISSCSWYCLSVSAAAAAFPFFCRGPFAAVVLRLSSTDAAFRVSSQVWKYFREILHGLKKKEVRRIWD